MFSITAINDTDSKSQWQPQTPTKEAQEFHLSQMYNDGLLKLQAKDYQEAQKLLEAVLEDPLVSNAQVENSATDGHLLQLRFLSLRNLATVFVQRGPNYHEKALRCYIQAVEIDSNDSVIWNQLGTLSCSMGSLSISRWAFEQGLVCSPNNWNCMEKLLEVLIAIGDEMACLSVANLILGQWPSHSRALHVKNTIEESEPIPFAPRGIDKLEPRHILLKFGEKRKAPNEDIDKAMQSKRLKQSIELQLTEASWIALASALLEILSLLVASGSEQRTEEYGSGHDRVSVQLNLSSGNVISSVERREPVSMTADASMSVGNCNSGNDGNIACKEGAVFEEQPPGRRSSRLRSRKPDKDESDFATNKDVVKVVKQFLGPYLVGGARLEECNHNGAFCVDSAEVVSSSLDTQCSDVIRFVQKNSENCGAYHMSHLLLEEIANRGISHQDSNSKIMDLEKFTRHYGLQRTPECSLFLAEVYYDFGIRSSDSEALCEFMTEVSYHLCKIIENVALEYPFPITGVQQKENYSLEDNSEQNPQSVIDSTPLLRNNHTFWVRFSWLSAHLSLLDGDKAKARQQLSVALSLLAVKEKMNSLDSICLPHCKAIKKLTADIVLHEINLIEVDYLMKKTVNEMLEKHMYAECVNLLSSLLLSASDVHVDVLYAFNQEGKGFNSVELSALDALIRACEHEESIDVAVYLNCHRRKLQILVAATGLEGISSNKTPTLDASSTESTESISKHWNHLVAEEVKAISESAWQIKNTISSNENPNFLPMTVVGDIQSLLVALMCNIAETYFSKKSPGLGVSHSTEQTERCSFVDAAIAFCKLQHLDPNVPIKTQTELIGSIHDMLAEFGVCCAHGIGEEEGTFLKFAIKRLLALDMKLKSNFQSSSKGQEINSARQSSPEDHLKKSEQLSDGIHINGSPNKSHFNMPTMEVAQTDDKNEASASRKDVGRLSSEGLPSHVAVDSEEIKAETDVNVGDGPGVPFQEREIQENQIDESGNEPLEDEEEELELRIDNALDQCFYCLYGLNLRSDSYYEEDLAMHKNTSRGDYQTKEQCADVFQYILPYAKASSKTGLTKLRRVLRAIRKHFPQPPDDILAGNAIDKFLDDPDMYEDKILMEAGSDGFLDYVKIVFSELESIKQNRASSIESCRSEPYLEVYSNLFYLLAQSEEISATDKWAGFVLTKEGEEFVEQNANLFKYDLLYNPLHFESWQRLANFYDEEVDLLLNDGSKQINVLEWRKNATLAQRVERSRRRSRRCLFMTLALAKTESQQGEIHELLALVYYDGIQNVVPIYDQRFFVPTKDAAWKIYCKNAMRHFEKAFKHREEWSHAFYLGKLSEKLGHPHDVAFSYYATAIALNPSAVDSFYRMHASRLKLLCACGKRNEEALKVVAAYSFANSTKENAMNILSRLDPESSESSMLDNDRISNDNAEPVDLCKFEEAWDLLYSDCLSALETCVEGDLKHFHKARYMLAQGLYKRGRTEDVEKAKEELSFCFKSSRSSFTINMWEIDSTAKRVRRKTPGPSGNRRTLEVNLAESSRKFITCIRKYILFYLKLLEETGEISTLERAYISLRADKRFSLCLEDLVPVALGRYIRALIFSLRHSGTDLDGANNVERVLEKLFSLLLEQVNLWPDICCLPELSCPELTESSLCGYLYMYIQWLERHVKVETLEGINEKIRKRLKNPKLSNSNCAKVYRHVSAAWCRSLVVSMALITPLHSRPSQVQNLLGGEFENEQLLCVDLQSEELWNSAFEDMAHLKMLESKWNPSLSRIKNVMVKKVSDEDLETASSLLRSSYNFYKDTSCALLPSGINLYLVPSQLATEMYIQPGLDGVDLLDMNTSRKLLLWAYTLLHGRCPSFSLVLKYCEENLKPKMKRGTGSSSVPTSANVTTASAPLPEVPKSPAVAPASLPESADHKETSSTLPETGNKPNLPSTSLPETGHLPVVKSTNWANEASSFSAAPCLIHCSNPVTEISSMDLQNDTDPNKG